MTQKRSYNTNKSKDSGNRIRVRGKRLDQVDETKLTLAYWLLAKQIVEDKTDGRPLSEAVVRKVVERLNQAHPAAPAVTSDGSSSPTDTTADSEDANSTGSTETGAS